MTEEDQDSPAKEPEAPPAPTPSEADAAEDSAGEPAEPAASPKKVKKSKRKKRAREGRESLRRPELDAQGRERPVFLLGFPNDSELEPLIAAFEAGNYAHVRKVAPTVAERSEDPEVKAAARELLARIDPDPLIKFLLAVAIALFVAVVLFVYHSHG